MKVPMDVSGRTDVTYVYDRETGDYRNLTTKDHKADTEKGERLLGEASSKKSPKVVFASTDMRYRDSKKAKILRRSLKKHKKQARKC